MEPQEQFCCYEKKCKSKNNCLCIIFYIALALFVGIIGVILGAALSSTILAALPAIIVLAIILGLLTIFFLILCLCKRQKKM